MGSGIRTHQLPGLVEYPAFGVAALELTEEHLALESEAAALVANYITDDD